MTEPLALTLTFLLLALAVSLAALALRTSRRLRLLRAEYKTKTALFDAADREVASLRQYRGIPDAEEHSRQLVAVARAEAERTRAEAEALLRSETQKANGLVAAASAKADALVRDAEARAVEIAGAAYAAKRDAVNLEKAIKAMKNIIEGYGDEYIVPHDTVIDALAEELGYADAGVHLKAARDHTRAMMKKGSAATCDYVEQYRRETAIRFVLDAFNGKVDTVLSNAKHDNFGTLRQQIDDARSVVNANGAAFRNARISQEYLDARISELRWLVAGHELKQREKEEQRAIKERIREEERARREYERAIREAQKEEEMLQRAMDKVKDQLSRANDAQREKYEAQLLDLTQRLQQAEEKNQRALSMAQQTRMGHVYIISNVGSFGENIYKIGLTRRLEPLDRVRELGDASVPFDFDVHAIIRSDDAPRLESDLHKQFIKLKVNKVNARKEFFRVPLAEVRKCVERLGITPAWTMAAAAQEYRETVAIEKAMTTKDFDEHAWVEKQLAAEHDEEVAAASGNEILAAAEA